jgi:cytochrome c553
VCKVPAPPVFLAGGVVVWRWIMVVVAVMSGFRLRVVALGVAVAAGLPGLVSAQADEARAKKIVGGVCFVCHGMEGELSSEAFPRLAGRSADDITRQLQHFKSGERKSSAMGDMVARLTSDEMVALGRYFSRQSAAPVELPKEAAASEALVVR